MLDGDRGRQAFDVVEFGLLKLVEELPGVRRQRLHVLPLPLGEHGVERQRGFARARKPGHDDELVARDVDVDVL
ncbi:MAG: hypothetical protein QM770_00135 [Tepidisphaeraceae bacterium]